MRSDKDSEPETYGEGIKKEIQYRRTPFRRTNRFSGPRKIVAQADSIKDIVFTATKAGFFDSARSHTSRRRKKPVATGRFFRWTVCRLGYSEGAAMAVGSASLHIGI